MKRKPAVDVHDQLDQAWVAGVRYYLDTAFRDARMDAPDTAPMGPDGFTETWRVLRQFSLVDPWRAAAIAQHLWDVRNLPGDVIECGVFQGATSILMALLLKRWNIPKRVWMLDSFEGLPRPHSALDAFYKQGWGVVDEAAVRRGLALAGVTEHTHVVRGWFKDTLPRIPPQQGFCLAHLDGDLYDSTTDCLTHLHPRMPKGAVVVLDDHHDNCGGVRRALEEHVKRTGEQRHAGPLPQVHIRVGETGKAPLSFAELQRNKPYQRWTAQVAQQVKQDSQALHTMQGLVSRRGRRTAQR